MILKTLSRKSNPSQLISYVARYLMKEGKYANDKEHMRILVEHNLRKAHTVEEYIAAFKRNESFRIHKRIDNPVLFHTIVSLSPDDKDRITLAMLTDLAQQFITLRGTNCLHLATAHLEKPHAHLHIVTSGVTVSGKSSRLSRQEFKDLLTTLEAYQQRHYPELTHSQNTHEKTIDFTNTHFTDQRKITKHILRTQLETILSNASSYESLLQALSDQNYDLYHRNGVPQGIIADGIKYRFTNIGVPTDTIHQMFEQQQTFSDLQTLRSKCPEKQQIQKTAKGISDPVELDDDLLSIRQMRERANEEREITLEMGDEDRGRGMPP